MRRNLAIVIFCTAVAFAVLYLPQPVLPVLAEHWGVSPAQVSLLITVCMLALGIAPLLYGYVLEMVSARTLLMAGYAVLALCQIGIGMAPDYPLFLALRIVQGLVLPAIFTALMTYVSGNTEGGNVRRGMSIYIAATILGGFSGRTVTGVLSDWIDWQAAFVFWALLAVLALAATGLLAADARLGLGQVRRTDFRRLLGNVVYRQSYLTIFLVFFVFAAMLNFLPFRMREIDAGISDSAVALVYAGYLIGIAISLSSHRILAGWGGEARVLQRAVLIYCAGTALFGINWLPMLYPAMFVFAAGMFLIHSVLSGLLNHLEQERKGLVNGLYVAFYYAGGALGSFAPGFVYQYLGWNWFIGLLIVVLAIMWLLVRRLANVAT